ncbi:MAG: phosphate acyltransferase PlsX [Candidatus Auribacterota bacterium]|jgi:glycerol-3-phosphate acyltransferase PlsX|nr:phosphate acyltransferase PlsX [Candidatus Auribacterota bacterium]
MRIAIDAMGGDYAPESIVAGALDSLEILNGKHNLLLVGDKPRIEELLSKHGVGQSDVMSIHHASEVVGMDESPSITLRKKKNSSIAVCASLAKSGEVDALLSAGNTGAVVAATKLRLRFLKGVERPAIATPIPTADGVALMLDAGANVDSKPHNLLQFAAMGSAYSKYILGKDNPRVGLLSIGEEPTKGNDLTKETFKLLESSPLNFMGNIEGRDIFYNKVDVIVTDGFVGNIVLKVIESMPYLFKNVVLREIKKNLLAQIGALLLQPALKKFVKQGDYAEYGGAPLLGVDGICIICHGSSSPKAIKNAIRLAVELSKFEINKHIEEIIEKLSFHKVIN